MFWLWRHTVAPVVEGVKDTVDGVRKFMTVREGLQKAMPYVLVGSVIAGVGLLAREHMKSDAAPAEHTPSEGWVARVGGPVERQSFAAALENAEHTVSNVRL